MTSDLFVRWENGTAVRIHHRAVKVMGAYEIRNRETGKVVDVVFSSKRSDVERALVKADSQAAPS